MTNREQFKRKVIEAMGKDDFFGLTVIQNGKEISKKEYKKLYKLVYDK